VIGSGFAAAATLKRVFPPCRFDITPHFIYVNSEHKFLKTLKRVNLALRAQIKRYYYENIVLLLRLVPTRDWVQPYQLIQPPPHFHWALYLAAVLAPLRDSPPLLVLHLEF
jgi:hypothetical protein